MKQHFSETLKALRRSSDITQDRLAEFIGVTPQTVSKWERAETYPDIETLPILANYFGVTIDELLGNDGQKTEAAIDACIAEIRETGLRDEAAALLLAKEGYRKYPYSWKMMDAYMNALDLYCPGREAWQNEIKAEVRRIAELILDGCTDDGIRYDAIGMIALTADTPEEYRAACERIPAGFNFTQELWLEEAYKINTPEGLLLRQKNILELMWWFLSKAENLCGRRMDREPDSPRCDTDTWIAVNEMKLAVYRAVFRDGDFLGYTWNMAWAYHHLAEAWMEKGDCGRALDSLENMAEFAAEHEKLPPYAKHTSYLVSELAYDESGMGLQGSCGSPEDYLHWMKSPVFDPVREEERFRAVQHLLETCPRNLRIRDESDFAWCRRE